MSSMTSTSVEIVRVHGPERHSAGDRVATEEPLEVRLNGQSFAVIMRTPGADRELAAGFLFAERVLTTADDLGLIEYCRDEGRAVENVVNVTLTEGAREAADRALAERRQVMVNASCGLCGRLTIEGLREHMPALDGGATLSAALIGVLPDRLRAAQPLFDLTGGLHAAGLFAAACTAASAVPGTLVASAEDVGRHNAVDKVVGRMLMGDLLPCASHALFVSGRTSFEIVQKAWCAGIAIVASVSAPSSLAIDLARDAGITLVGFVRDGTFNIYTHPERIR